MNQALLLSQTLPNWLILERVIVFKKTTLFALSRIVYVNLASCPEISTIVKVQGAGIVR